MATDPATPRSPEDFPVVGIGASAGGLAAFQKLFDALPPDSGMAYILVQHLDPTHQSLMVELLSRHTQMTVQHAADGMRLAPDCVYVIPPGVYLAVDGGTLRLSEPRERHGARLPIDFLLRSLAQQLGERAVGVVLSGTGSDGSAGLKAVKEANGLVIAQDPAEAAHDGMPRSAIRTGAVDLVLPVAEIPEALVTYDRRMSLTREQNGSGSRDAAPGWLPEIIELLRTKTSHDFTRYKAGTLRRRIERRMAMAAIDTDDMSRYIDALRSDPAQLDLLAKDLLIHVTGFFRDSKVFDFLAETVGPDLVRSRSPDIPLRIWVAGCSSGEEAYSLAMLFHEQIAAAGSNVRLQIFASDVDPDAVAIAREGLYPKAIEADVSPERLVRFFTREERGYRIAPELRAVIVFTVQDVLTDPPFSRIDLISCRNVFIYLQPEAQAKVTSLFHFALCEGGVLLLGNSETVGNVGDRFELVSEPARLYRKVGRSRPGMLGAMLGAPGGSRLSPLPGQGGEPTRGAALADLCLRLVMEAQEPAAVLINGKHECLHALGPVDRYLRVMPGQPTNDVLAMAREGVRTKLRSAIQQVNQRNAQVVVMGGRMGGDGDGFAFTIEVRPVSHEGEELLFVRFVEEREQGQETDGTSTLRDADLERELEATRTELEGAIRGLEESVDAQKVAAEEALTVNEEFLAANEELLASKEELQSLNEELTALNTQLQETLERQRTAANDLQNILFSTDVATLFLDKELNIRFFTPTVKSLFNVIPGDVGRPLEDLKSLAVDGTLPCDTRTVLQTHAPIEREIEDQGGTWYIRRVLPYRTQDNEVEGIVITYTDITERKRATEVVEAARRQAEQANVTKSRFLAVASHDLRQPLQTLALLQGILAKVVEGEQAQKLVARIADAAATMSGMLNALLDINKIETGTVHAEMADFAMNDLLDQMRDEFSYLAQARGLGLRVIPCGGTVRSDPQLLAQMIRNLLSNALKYTEHGKVLLGCRRRHGILSIEVWDTGAGFSEDEIPRIFDEYYQLDNGGSARGRGLGLGLSIVRRLAELLGYRLRVRSQPGKGSVFAIEVELAAGEAPPRRGRDRHVGHNETDEVPHGTSTILVAEDDPDVCEFLELALAQEGYRVVTAPDGSTALELVATSAAQPDLIVADYNLPGGMNGLGLVAAAWRDLDRRVPVIILTGDISAIASRDIARQSCTLINKPIKLDDLIRTIRLLLESSEPAQRPRAADSVASAAPIVYVVDDDSLVLRELRGAIEEGGWAVETCPTAEAFLASYLPGHEACLLIDAYLPGMSGLDLLERLGDFDHRLTTIMITGHGDVQTAVRAMKAGASDFIEKPVGPGVLRACIERALVRSADEAKQIAWRENAAERLAGLTQRQREIMTLILAGHPNKNIAADLGISQRTVESHRAAIMRKTGAKSLPALARLALAAAGNAGDTPLPGGSVPASDR